MSFFIAGVVEITLYYKNPDEQKYAFLKIYQKSRRVQMRLI